MVRSVAGQFREAWEFEAARLTIRRQNVFGPRTGCCSISRRESSIAIALSFLSLRSLAFWLAQAVLAIFMLELFNYIAHYGLQRGRRASGGFERIAPRHSWNSRAADE